MWSPAVTYCTPRQQYSILSYNSILSFLTTVFHPFLQQYIPSFLTTVFQPFLQQYSILSYNSIPSFLTTVFQPFLQQYYILSYNSVPHCPKTSLERMQRNVSGFCFTLLYICTETRYTVHCSQGNSKFRDIPRNVATKQYTSVSIPFSYFMFYLGI